MQKPSGAKNADSAYGGTIGDSGRYDVKEDAGTITKTAAENAVKIPTKPTTKTAAEITECEMLFPLEKQLYKLFEKSYRNNPTQQ